MIVPFEYFIKCTRIVHSRRMQNHFQNADHRSSPLQIIIYSPLKMYKFGSISIVPIFFFFKRVTLSNTFALKRGFILLHIFQNIILSSKILFLQIKKKKKEEKGKIVSRGTSNGKTDKNGEPDKIFVIGRPR